MDRYSTNTLLGVVENLLRPPQWFLDRFFGSESLPPENATSEEISFERILGKRRVAPFVSPLVAGQVVEAQGREVNSFRPAYVKDKRRFNPVESLKRAVGERFGGGDLSGDQRRDLYLAAELADQMDMLHRRLELMAAEAVLTGKVTVEGEKYPKVVVDFRRDATLSPAALTSTARWGESAAKPRKNLRTWAKAVLKASGAFPIDVVMGLDAFDAFADDPTVEKILDIRNVTNATLAPGAQPIEGGVYRGSIDGFNIWSYGGWYVDPMDGTEKEIFPATHVALVSPLVAGVRAHGAILDGKAGYRPLPFFPKLWEENDPPVEWLMLQSAPLMVPTRPDASLGVQVMG